MITNTADETAESVLATAEVFIRFGRLDAAEKGLKSAIPDFFGDSLALILTKLALVHELQGQFKQALQCLRQAIQHAQSVAEPGLCLATLLCDLSQYDEAKKAFAGAAGADDSVARAQKIADSEIASLHLQIALLYENSGRTELSDSHLDTALKLFESGTDAARLRARQLVNKRRPKELLKFLDGPTGSLLPMKETEVFAAIAVGQLDGVTAGLQRLQTLSSSIDKPNIHINQRLTSEWSP